MNLQNDSAAAVCTLRDVGCGADWNNGVVERGSV